jgi:hypothetical protein
VINGSYVPVLFASSSQIQFLCPAVPPATALAIAVETASGLSNRLETRVEEASPGIYAADSPEAEPELASPASTLSFRATGMNWLAKFPTARLFAKIGEHSVPVETNTPDPESAGVSRLTVTVPPDVSGDFVPVVIQVVQMDGELIESNSTSIPVDLTQRHRLSTPVGR